jgi:hypothetical protein
MGSTSKGIFCSGSDTRILEENERGLHRPVGKSWHLLGVGNSHHGGCGGAFLAYQDTEREARAGDTRSQGGDSEQGAKTALKSRTWDHITEPTYSLVDILAAQFKLRHSFHHVTKSYIVNYECTELAA